MGKSVAHAQRARGTRSRKTYGFESVGVRETGQQSVGFGGLDLPLDEGLGRRVPAEAHQVARPQAEGQRDIPGYSGGYSGDIIQWRWIKP